VTVDRVTVDNASARKARTYASARKARTYASARKARTYAGAHKARARRAGRPCGH